jgi:hypothetical protein
MTHQHDTTTADDTVLQVLLDVLILVLCYRQVACPEMFSEEELIGTAVLLDEEKRKSKQRKWVHESLLQRKEEGRYFTFYKELVEDSVRFHQYFRMSESMYLNMLSLIEEDLMKKNTTFREDMSPREKLAICLR